MKRFIILTAVTAVVISAKAQNTTYGGSGAPYAVVGGYVSDYSPSGTFVLADGSVSLSNNATYEHGNNLLQNNGSWTATSGSLDLFSAAGAVTISGSAAPDFLNLQFQNGAGVSVTNAGGINIAGQLTFGTAGIISTVRASHSNGALHFANNAIYIGGSTDAQHVNGYVSKAGNGGFTFPVGSGTDVRTLAISAPASATNEFSVAWIAGDPGTNGDPSNGNALHPTAAATAPIVSVGAQGQWDWVAVSGTGAGLTVSVSLPGGLTGSPASELRLVGWNGTSWVNLSGTTGATGNVEGATLSGTMIAGITAVGIGMITTPLPVTFGSFVAHKQGCAAQLNWTTFTEHNNAYFAVERSEDGISFKQIAEITASGNSTSEQSYSYTDGSPASGRNYYRIVQVDIDGRRSNTATERLEFDCADGMVKVYPTITRGTLYVSLPPGYEQAKIVAVDMHGRLVMAAGETTGLSRTLQLPSLAAGTYLLKVGLDNNTETTFKILYQP